MLKLLKHYDVIIIGAGIIGCATARALSRYRLNALVLEAQDDVTCGASKANSGIVHAGYDCYPGTLKAELNVKGAAMFPTLAKELDIPFRVNGSMVLCLRKEDYPLLETLYKRGQTNEVPGLQIISGEEAYKLEPNLAQGVHSALWAKKAAIVSPYEAAIAFAENAALNGVEFMLDTEVTQVGFIPGRHFTVETANEIFSADVVINTAGVNSDTIHNYLAQDAEDKEETLPQRGQYYMLDNAHRDFVNCTLFPLPGPLGKGVLIAPTTDGNIIVGPNAEELSEEGDFTDRFDTQTTRAGLDDVLEKAKLSVANLPIYGNITTFAGIRAKHISKDFILKETLPGFIHALGIDSPGLSAAPAIAEKLMQMAVSRLNPEENPNFNPIRENMKRFHLISYEEQEALIRKDSKYGHIVCRCEMVTEAEVVHAIRRPVGARNFDAVKRRTRCRGGRCQGGFCSLKIAEILSRELGVSEEFIWTY